PKQVVDQMKTPARVAGGFLYAKQMRLFLFIGLYETGKILLEARHAAPAIHDLLLAAGPGRMRLWVDVEMQDNHFLAPSGAGGEFTAVGHHHFDGVVARMDILLHR